ncbi:hypothetical protein [Yinghuangia sp. YIM S09857]|uniref:hypothetical protein n=1 Tax=Yinghuangia sp. YIM S09857 TaxID=3436929 RepID=UPI003F52EB92
MTGLFLPDGSLRHSSADAPQVEWRRLVVNEPFHVAVIPDPVRVVLTQRFVDESGEVREQVQVFGDARAVVTAIAVNDYMASVRGRIASDLSDIVIALGVPEAELEHLVESISQQWHRDALPVVATHDTHGRDACHEPQGD